MTEPTDTATIKLKPAMAIDNVAEFYDELSMLAENDYTKVVFDCSVNEEIDFAALQTLLAFYNHLKSRGTKIVWDNPSIVLFERSVQLGMDEALGL